MSEAVTTEQQRREYIEALMAGERERGERTDLRAMLACWAPQEIPHWFGCELEPMPTRPENPFPVGHPIHSECKEWLRDGCWDLGGNCLATDEDNEKAKRFQDECNRIYVERNEVERRNLERRFFQWRIYYADRMLECLGK